MYVGTYNVLCKFCSDGQRLLTRTEGLVEKSFEVVEEYDNMIVRCKREMEILKDERKKLMGRIKEIDKDVDEVHTYIVAVDKRMVRPVLN